jgi:hypothetical protein
MYMNGMVFICVYRLYGCGMGCLLGGGGEEDGVTPGQAKRLFCFFVFWGVGGSNV